MRPTVSDFERSLLHSQLYRKIYDGADDDRHKMLFDAQRELLESTDYLYRVGGIVFAHAFGRLMVTE